MHAVGHCSRCDTVVEPRLSLQWWVKVAELAQAAGDAVRDGRTKIHPAELEKKYFDWVDNMHDWTISRQLWWGPHPGLVRPGRRGRVRGPGRAAPSGEGWTQDPDVLDTWFSSGLWPMSTMGWPDGTADLAKFYPTSVLSTGYDLLFFWVVRMMMFRTKLWNASKFAMMNGATAEGSLPSASESTGSDRWILGRLAALVSEVDGLFEDFQFAKVANALYQFTWNELCDWCAWVPG